MVVNAKYVGIRRALGLSFSRSFQLLKIFGPSCSGPTNSAPRLELFVVSDYLRGIWIQPMASAHPHYYHLKNLEV